MDKENFEDLLTNFDKQDIYKGKRYYEWYIRDQKKINNSFEFKVESERTQRKYKVMLSFNENTFKIENYSCECNRFKEAKSCKHIAACLYYRFDKITALEQDKKVQFYTKLLFNKFDGLIVNEKEKEELHLEFHFNNSIKTKGKLDAVIKIGNNKMYSLTTKLNPFLTSYFYTKELLKFGKDLIYNPSIHFLNDYDDAIIIAIGSKNGVTSQILRRVLSNIDNYRVYLNSERITKIKSGLPYKFNLLKNENDMYKIEILKNEERAFFIMEDNSIFNIDNELYCLGEKSLEFVNNITKNNLKTLLFRKEDINAFASSILPTIKDDLTIDDEIDIVIEKPKTSLYFDFKSKSIKCIIKHKYGNITVENHQETCEILRDISHENKVLNDILKIGFRYINKELKIIGDDKIAEFIDEKMLFLSKEYEIFTTEKFDNIKIIKNSTIKSTFSIGKDNIMNYNFELGDINPNELDSIFLSLNKKEKYYKLKNGNYLNLEQNKKLFQLENLVNDMDLINADYKKGKGIIPKYRAIYLDSLKKDKYDIITTNNSFNKLIENFNKYKNNKLIIDNTILRDYQSTGVKWLYNIHKSGFGGILADEMGLGKSIQTIYFIKQLLKENLDSKFLIVVPTSLAYNWKNEFDKFGKEINYKLVIGNKNKRINLLKNFEESVIITTYGLLREDKKYYDEIKFTSFIIDEAQNIKNQNAAITQEVKTINSESKFALTGTPLENSVIELWSIFDFIMPGFLTNLTKFQKKYKIKDINNKETQDLIDQLNKLVSPFILRRRKFEVASDLPDKIENNIYIDLTKKQKQAYIHELNRVNNEIEKVLKQDGINKAKFMILTLLTRLRQICIDPRLVFEDFNEDSSKIINLLKVIKESTSNGHKILLFTSFKSALQIVKNELDKNNISYYTIDGSVPSKKRIDLVDKFNSDKTNVFLIMLKSGGTGLNLTSADVVIHLDLWWNPQAENQATDRAHRIGQKNKVEVIKLIARGTIEEKILELQNKKRILSDKLIDNGNNSEHNFSSLTEEDIKNLLSFDN